MCFVFYHDNKSHVQAFWYLSYHVFSLLHDESGPIATTAK